jgi:anti-sigma B factor antagonist
MSERDVGSFGLEHHGDMLTVRGDVDESVAARFGEALANPAVEVVDLAAVTFLDSAGLRAMVAARRQRQANGGPFVLRAPSRMVLRLLELTGLESAFTVDEGGAEPVASPQDQTSRGDPVS